MWEAHYIQRAFIYPFGLRDRWKPMPALVSLMGGIFNLVNAYLNGRYLFDRSGDRYQADWLTSPQFIIGLVLFIAGLRHQPPGRCHPARPAQGEEAGLQDPLRWDVPLYLLSQLFWRDRRMDRLGHCHPYPCPAWPLHFGPSPTLLPRPAPITGGITSILQNTLQREKHSSQAYGDVRDGSCRPLRLFTAGQLIDPCLRKIQQKLVFLRLGVHAVLR